MNAFEALLNLPEAEKDARGVTFTPAEIAQQPRAWQATAEILCERRDEIQAFLEAAGLRGADESVLLLAGAGTSEFVGNATAPVLRTALGREVLSVPTTHWVTHAASTLVPHHRYVLLSFARSGNSPESVATCRMVKALRPDLHQIVITCNAEGALAQAAVADRDALCLLLPPETNDRSLVMTSSFSSMAFAALGLAMLDRPDAIRETAVRIGAAADRIVRVYGDLLSDFAGIPFTRACFLGSDALCGTMQECHLKMQEMTEGRVASRFDSFLGLRHGPQVFVDDTCAVVAALATDPYARRYELDLLAELKRKQQGCGTLVICDRETPEIRDVATEVIELFPDVEPVADGFRIMTDVVAGQILGTFKSLAVGLKPDNPSTSGTINRVVEGVTIYDTAPVA
jgi:tagatose-6-phosphate ketose/aldose isomerase